MGASHPGDIKELVDIVHPNYGIITNVGRAHLEGFGSFEGVIRTKGELYDYIRRPKARYLSRKRTSTFSLSPKASNKSHMETGMMLSRPDR